MFIEPYAHQIELTVSENGIHDNNTTHNVWGKVIIKWVTVTNNHKFPNSTRTEKQITPEDNEHLTLQLCAPAKTKPWTGC
jgi:hypothetical protein